MLLVGVLCRLIGYAQRALFLFPLLILQSLVRHHPSSERVSLRRNEHSCTVNNNWVNLLVKWPFYLGEEVCHIKTVLWAKSGSQELVSLALKNQSSALWLGWALKIPAIEN